MGWIGYEARELPAAWNQALQRASRVICGLGRVASDIAGHSMASS